MLQVKNLRKEYVTNKSVVTTALDGVTLNFPETGMVFILGKSGSGKSTLLNLCGGLDKPSSGEIILNGKSCKDFKEKDFDLYRNTFAGFVFQEYNIVEEYTVEENVALALELQGKRNKQEVAKILEEADLFDLAARKANTLSGGQKQRVAIARALVKQPQIILADEPTGALDSQTGTQIFDLLKKYSENRLVLVVSHDRDFAERYADRIIELQDGKVLSDVVRLPNGSFGELDAQPDPPLKEQSAAFLRARLPFRHALRMGFGYLKSKPVRLAFSIILCVFAFVLFGLSSTLMFYSENSVMAETIRLDQGNYVALNKYYKTHLFYRFPDGKVVENNRTIDNNTRFTVTEYEELKKKYPDALAAVKSSNKPHNFSWEDLWYYYGSNWANYVIADPSLKVLAGRLPTAEDEIALPEFLFQVMKLEQSKFVLVTEEDLAAGKLVNEDAPKHPVNTYGDVLYSESNPATIFVMVYAIPALTDEKTVEMFERFKVFTRAELQSRAEIKYENYAKAINIEARTMIDMASKQIIPAVMRYTKELADTVVIVREAGADASVQSGLLEKVSALLGTSKTALDHLAEVTEEASRMKEGQKRAEYYYTDVMTAMEGLRTPIDELEMIVDKDVWPMPSYGDLIFEV